MEKLANEELSYLELEFPTLARVLRSQQNEIEMLSSTLDQQQAEERAAVNREIQAAIDANPKLAAWQVIDPERFTEAAKIDQVLRASPKYANVPFEERFAKVVELTEVALEPQHEQERAAEEPKQQDGLEHLSTADLAGRFSGMGLDQIEQFLADLAQSDHAGR